MSDRRLLQRSVLSTRKMSVPQKIEALACDGWELDIDYREKQFHIIFIHNERQFVIEKEGTSIGMIIRQMYPALIGMRQDKEQTK